MPGAGNLLLVAGFLCFLLVVSCTRSDEVRLSASEREIEKYLHVPSPAWEDQIIYFIVTDRFMDGDTTNNDQGQGEYNKGDGAFWNGGDLKGITDKLDYIQELGATAIWITPPVANQWVNPQKTGSGNHGYWAMDFESVDKHLGTLEDYQKLSASLHKRGMFLIQDVVVNHMGDYYTYKGPYDPEDVTKNFHRYDLEQPSRFPFNHNDASKAEDRDMAIYHFTPNFYDHSDTIKKTQYQFADLDDLNTANPIVRKELRRIYSFWIEEVGVDGFRFDTPHMVEHEFWYDFLHAGDTESMGIIPFARTLGKEHFFCFGETALFPQPYDDELTIKAARYLGTSANPAMNSILNFPLTISIGRVFKEKRATDLLTHRLNSAKQIFARPDLLVNFIDNHDGPRFLTATDRTAFRQALLFILTIPGVPAIYYGTEQELLGMRQAMFRGGVGSPDKDHFNTNNESFLFVRDLVALRKANETFRRGELTVLRDSKSGPGIFIYALGMAESYWLVLINTASSPMLVDGLETEFSEGTVLESIYSLNRVKVNLTVMEEGKLDLVLEGGAGMILKPVSRSEYRRTSNGTVTIDPLQNDAPSSESLAVTGSTSEIDQLEYVIDADLTDRSSLATDAKGRWTAQIATRHLMNGRHRLTFFSQDGSKTLLAVDHLDFEVLHTPKLIGSYPDPLGDDKGPKGNYSYPTQSSYTNQMDIRQADVYQLGSNLQIDLTMASVSQIWLPPNGFDHVLVNIYIDIPGKQGRHMLPLQNARMPGDRDWDYMVSTAGFGNVICSSTGAAEQKLGKRIGPTAFTIANVDQQLVRFIIAAQVLVPPTDLSGLGIYINTWDGGPGNLRPLRSQSSTWTFGGGNDHEPKIMDDVPLIVIP